MTLRRGFKAEAERLATDTWDSMALGPADRLNALELAMHVGCQVHAADELVSKEKLQRLKQIQDDAFFACTFKLPGERYVIVFNPLVSETRRNSDIAHEVSHILLRHRLSRLEQLNGVAFLSGDHEQEEEAAWLSGCLLLPRFALLHDLKNEILPSDIAKERQISEDMVDYRIKVTGVQRQLDAARRRDRS